MTATFFISSAAALAAAAVGLTRPHPVRGLLLLAIALVGVGGVLLAAGAPLLAALHVIIYAGAIVVLFLFAVMTAGISAPAVAGEGARLGPGALAAGAIAFAAWVSPLAAASSRAIGTIRPPGTEPRELAVALFEPYAAGVLLAALLLFAGLLATHHIAREGPRSRAGDAPGGATAGGATAGGAAGDGEEA